MTNGTFNLGENAVLMRLSISIPGEERQDPSLTGEVKAQHNLGAQSGKWVKKLYPPEALGKIKKLDNEARGFHGALTLPYDQGIGILPGKLIPEYGDRMRHFAGMRENLIENEFLANPEKWIAWAIKEHNGTFDPDFYPGLYRSKEASAELRRTGTPIGLEYILDVEGFKAAMRAKFAFETVPLPVPNSNHFTNTIASLLGTDTASIDMRVRDAGIEAQKELLRRMIDPVKSMAQKLAEKPKVKKDGSPAEDIVFRDTLVSNLRDIAKVGPALNLNDDPVIAQFCRELDTLSKVEAQTLRDNKQVREDVQKKADDLAKRLSGYKF